MGMTIRDAYGKALVKCGETNQEIVVLDADVSGSTKSGVFGAVYPERFFNVGIAEQNMVAMAAGMAIAGKTPFVNTFAVFMATLGSLPARELIAYGNLNVKLVGAYGGLSDAYDGATHHAIEDISFFRSIPNMKVLVASDNVITESIVKLAVNDKSPMYIRLSRDEMDVIYTSEDTFELGKGKMLREGEDVTIIACGIMVGRALAAAGILADQGIQATVVDMFCIKPIDHELVRECAKVTGAIVTSEEHSIIGGLGSAVAEVVTAGDYLVPIESVGIQDTFTESGSYEALSKKYRFTVDDVVEAAKRAVKRKKRRLKDGQG